MRWRGIFYFCLYLASFNLAGAVERFVDLSEQGRLVYEQDAQGNRMPDFSSAGYGGGGVSIPQILGRVLVYPQSGDDGYHIQSAIDYVSSLESDINGFRGAVVLGPGRFEIQEQLRIQTSGVILRGSGTGSDGTLLVAAGKRRRPLISVEGTDVHTNGKSISITDAYVPVGATNIHLDTVEGLKSGQTVMIRRPSPQAWIDFMGMGSLKGRPAPTWKEHTLDIRWERTIREVHGNMITLLEPLTCALETRFGGGEVQPFNAVGRLRNVGVENLRCESEWDPNNPHDEEHAWICITLNHVDDAWVRQVEGKHFVSSLVDVTESCRRITVMDCRSLAPVSEMGGYRRHSFYTAGQQTLFLRCYAEQGRHDFAVGWRAAGPNAFVHCESHLAHDFSGPIESWATGVLFDNLIMDGGGLKFDHREIWGNGVGWAAGNCVAWQCSVPIMVNRQPPGAQNWTIACWAQFVGDGNWRSSNEFVDPDSLYEAQLKERLGDAGLEALESCNFDQVLEADQNTRVWSANQVEGVKQQDSFRTMEIQNGWILVDDRLAIGHQPQITWWRGHAMSSRTHEFGINLTRFVPGRAGQGLTDDLPGLAKRLSEEGAVGLRHHPGLWYDRRRDDHQMTRRVDGNVWPPFYELPWARIGKGKAWDGLSLYDLRKFNPWYFNRLNTFADHSRRQGLVFMNAMYFQHHLLEAGAHWADYPWRSANNINHTGFPEPPPYVRRKRIFMADDFYDVTHSVRRDLHQRYIFQCLNNLSTQPNVIHVLGEEYSGPLHFMEFWIDCVGAWMELETPGSDPTIGLSAPKDVQDAILSDDRRSKLVDVIDFKYWWISPKGLFAPKGGENLAPRQHERLWKGGRPKDETLAQMASSYRSKYPHKAISSAFDQAKWAYLCAGGSLPNLPKSTDPDLLSIIPMMEPWITDDQNRIWSLWSEVHGGLIYIGNGNDFTLDLKNFSGQFELRNIEMDLGKVTPETHLHLEGGREVIIPVDKSPAVYWIHRIR